MELTQRQAGTALYQRRLPLSRYTSIPQFSASGRRPAGCLPAPCRLQHSNVILNAAAPTGTGSAASSAAPAVVQQQQLQEQALTPRQRRLAQQRRKWEESQQQQSAPGASAPTDPSRNNASPAASQKPAAAPKPKAPQKKQQQQQQQATLVAAAPRSREAGSSSSSASSSAGSSTAAKREGSGRKPSTAAAGTAPSSHSSGGQVASAAATITAASTRPSSAPSLPTASTSTSTTAPAPSTRWPSLFTATGSGASQLQAHPQQQQQQLPAGAGTRVLPAPLTDLAALSAAELVGLAKHWTQELVDWQKRGQAGRVGGAAATEAAGKAASADAGVASGAGAGAGARLGEEGPGASGGRVGVSLQRLQSEGLSQLAAARLEQLTAAVDQLVKATSAAATSSSQPQQPAPLSQQHLADLVWAVAHYDWGHCVGALAPAMAVPFAVVPQFMPGLKLQDFMAEVRLNRDVIYLEDGSKAVEESRLTGWQSDIGATFKYSGKEMIPDPSGMTPAVRKVRDELQRMTGVWYDSVLINYYGDGKCGMRYHVDPLYGVWSPESAVVSIGDTRTFIFREISDYNSRWQYRVRNGDVVRMWGDCQDRLQHCVRVERAAEDAGPRMSLVFKERLRGSGGEYLQG